MIAHLFVDAGQFGAEMDEFEVHEAGAGFAGEFFGAGYEAAADSGFLAGGIDGEKAEVGAIFVAMDIDAAEDAAFLFGEKERPLTEVAGEVFGVEARLIFEEVFDLEGDVDEAQ